MNKKFLFSVFLCLAAAGGVSAQKTNIDTIAVAILDRMTAMIGSLSSCHYMVRSNYDIRSEHLGLVKHGDDEQIYMQGPNKLLIRSQGDRGARSLYYDGETLSYYSLENNQFASIPLTAPIVDMIDTVNKLYGIEFPASDFFYPTFVDDLLSESRSIIYLGMTKVEGKDCYHIAGTTPEMTYQFWISDDALTLPMKMVIVYTSRDMNPQYEATLSDWQVNPVLPLSLFEFMAPPKARKIKMAKSPVKK
ncbi:MAG TPA: DUF2092 domain-containing protein [Puia sp.]|nr:DUF2092 domain-containing protein [Puia sp.]